ncbi:hypothetical protein SBA2_440008 [Acidobacteriia bacterium SbA2]|nr:hypothetical protein SBA2_440008 [Acidobacteriia bacterium SbA2]
MGSPPPPSGLRSVACGRQSVSNSSTTSCPPAHLPTCPCFWTPRLLDCIWKQEPQVGIAKKRQERTSWHNRSGRNEPPAQPHRTTLAYFIPFVKYPCSQKNQKRVVLRLKEPRTTAWSALPTSAVRASDKALTFINYVDYSRVARHLIGISGKL